MKHFVNLTILSLVISLIPAVTGGCGQKDRDMRKVIGKVTYKGEPVNEALIQFVPLDATGLAASGLSGAEGNYTLTSLESKVPGSGTKPANYKVVVSKFEKPPVDPDEAALLAGQIDKNEYMTRMSAKPRRPTPPVKHLLPPKYAMVSTSPLEFTVEDKRENECNLILID